MKDTTIIKTILISALLIINTTPICALASSPQYPRPSLREGLEQADVVLVGKKIFSQDVYCDFKHGNGCISGNRTDVYFAPMQRVTYAILRDIKNATGTEITLLTERNNAPQGDYIPGELLLFLSRWPAGYLSGVPLTVGLSDESPEQKEALKFIEETTGMPYVPNAK